MITLQITVVDKVATYHKRGGHIVCGNSDYQIAFNFDAEWDGYTTKTARFISNGEHYDKVFSGNICPVPVLRDTDKVEVGVFVEGLETTTRAEISCRRSILCGGSTPSIENDIDYANEAKEAAERAAEAARVESEKLISELGVVQTLSQHDKRISNLERASGVDSFETDASVAYTKDVPVNALPYAELAKVGGMSYREGDVLKSAPVTGIGVVGKNLFDDSVLLDFGFTKVSEHEYFRNQIYTIAKTPFFTNTRRVSGSFTISGKFLYKDVGTASGGLCANVFYTDGTQASYPASNRVQGQYFDYTATTDASKIVDYICFTYGSSGIDTTIKKMQIERGKIATAHSPYTERTLPIPEAVQSLDGYGWGINELAYNYVDFEKKQFVKRVGCVDMGTLNWELRSAFAKTTFSTLFADIKEPANYREKVTGFISDKYPPSSSINYTALDDGCMIRADGFIYVRDSRFTDTATFKAAMSGVMLYYELAETVITDISHLLSDDNYIHVEGGGTLTFENEHKLAVPSEITYQIKEVTA